MYFNQIARRGVLAAFAATALAAGTIAAMTADTVVNAHHCRWSRVLPVHL